MELQIIKDKIITIRGQQVILDSDVAELYGVETKRINEAVRNNPKKFPDGYIISLSQRDKTEVVENFDHLASLKFSPTLPKAFSEKGLYMLATILKSPVATETTIAIVETFAKVRELSRTIAEISEQMDKEQQKSMMKKSGEPLSQAELAKEVGTIAVTIGRYERNEIKPSIEIATKIADVLGVSLDYLVGNTDILIEKDLLKKITDIQKLPENKKNVVMELLDSFLKQTKLQSIM